MKPQVILTGHDLGHSQAVNIGFEYALTKLPKVFSELSLLPNSPYSVDGAKIAKESSISTHLSFCFTTSRFKALTGISSLTDSQGYLHSVPNVDTWDFSVIDTFDPVDITKEIEAQYEWFLKHVGKKPSALVTQKGEHGDPKILEPLIKLAKAENLPMRAPLWNWQANYGAQSLVESEGIKTTSQFLVCFKDWQKSSGYDLELDFERIVSKVKAHQGVSELALFCGFCDQELFDTTSVSWQRGQLLNILKRKYYLIERLYDEFEIITYADLT